MERRSRYRPVWVLFLLCGLGIAATVLLFADAPTSSAPTAPTDSAAESPTQAAATTVSTPADPADDTRGLQRSANPGPATADQVLVADRADDFVLRILDAHTREPLPEAEVWYVDQQAVQWPEDPEERLQMELMSTQDEQTWIRQVGGRRARVDADGNCRIPRATILVVSARTEDRAGYGRFFHHRGTRQNLLLRPGGPLRIRVVDDRGEPAAAVRIFAEPPDGRRSVAALGESGPDGRFVVQSIQSHRFDGQYKVYAQAPGLESERLPFDPARPPAEELLLELPPSGGMVLQYRDPLGLVRGLTGLRMQLDPVFGRVHRLDDQGRVTFAHVGLGKTFHPHLESLSLFHRNLAGPEQPGEVVEHELELRPKAPVLVGRIEFPAGIEAPDRATLFGSFDGEKFTDHLAQVTIEADGRFLAPISFPVPGVRRLEMRVRKAFLTAPVPVPESMRPGVYDVGTVRLRSVPVLCSGTLHGHEGPSEPVSLSLRTEAGDQLASAEFAVEGPTPFSLRGPDHPDGPLYLHVVRGPYAATPPLQVSPGADKVDLHLLRGIEVELRVLVTPETPVDDLRPELVGAGISSPPSFATAGPGHQSATWNSVAPGTYPLQVTVPGMGAPLIDEPAVAIDALHADASGRVVVEFDLRESLQSLALEFATADGRTPPHEPEVLVFGAHSEVPGKYRIGPRGGTIPVQGPVDLVALVPGYEAALRYAVPPGSERIVFQPAPDLPITIDCGPVVAPKRLLLYWDVDESPHYPKTQENRWGRREVSDPHLESLRLVGGGPYTATAHPMLPGRYRLRLWIAAELHFELLAETYVDCPHDPKQPIRLQVSEETLRAAHAKIDAR